MFKSRASSIIIHLTGWFLFLAFPLLFMNNEQGNFSSWKLIGSPYYWLFCLTYMVLFYLNSFFLIPALVFRKKYLVYGTVIIGLLGCVYYLQPYDNLLAHNKNVLTRLNTVQQVKGTHPEADSTGAAQNNLLFGPLPNQDLRMQDPNLKKKAGFVSIHQSDNIDMVSLFIFMMIIGMSFATSTVQQWQTSEQKVVKAEAEKATAELSFLKAQINPHFLFNTLNNIYTLSVTGHKSTSDSIMKLSNIMRYMTDDVKEDSVFLKNEIECIRDYIELQKLRLGSNAKVNFEVPELIGYQKIAPFVLMTFVENAFKYGVSKKEPVVILIELKIASSYISFSCQNKVYDLRTAIESTGIGISNTRRRLEYLYPGKHHLSIRNEYGLFTVNLTVDC